MFRLQGHGFTYNLCFKFWMVKRLWGVYSCSWNQSLIQGESPAIWDHTMLPPDMGECTPILIPAKPAGTWFTISPTPEECKTLWWLVLYQDELPVHRQSTVLVMLVEQTAAPAVLCILCILYVWWGCWNIAHHHIIIVWKINSFPFHEKT